MTKIIEWLGWVKDNMTFPEDEDIDAMMAENVAKIEAMRAGPPPRVLPATEQLRTNLERAALVYADRERVLLDEIAAREAELADVRRARDAATAGLCELQPEPVVGEISLDTEVFQATPAAEAPDVVEADQATTKGGFSFEQIELSSGMGLDHIGHFYSVYRTKSPFLEDDASYRPRVRAAKGAYDG